MRRRLLIIAIFLLAGAVVNVAVAWTCAMTVNPLYGKMEDAEENVRGMEGFAVMHFSRPGATLITCCRRKRRFIVSSEQADPAALLDQWTGFRVPTHEYESGTTKIEERIAHGCGWPKLTLWCETYGNIRSWGPFGGPLRGGVETGLPPLKRDMGLGRSFLTFPRALPFRPIWPGVIVNTFFYATTLWLLFLGPFALRRIIRSRRGLCPSCAYPMGESATCTECGRPLAEHSSPPTATAGSG
jgi:hypothetical protein